MKTRREILKSIPLLLLAPRALSGAKPISFEFLDIPDISVRGINNAGDVSGEYLNKGLGFIRRANGDLIDLSVPVGRTTRAWGIDDNSVVGTFYRAGDIPEHTEVLESFIYQNGQYQVINFPNATQTEAFGVNANRVVGQFYDQAGYVHGFLYENGNWTQLDYPGALQTRAFGIDSAGRIFGNYFKVGEFRSGFIYDGQFQSISYPRTNTSLTELYGAGAGLIIGITTKDYCNYNPFVISNGKFFLLDLPGTVTGINDSGMAVGSFGSRGYIAKASNFIQRGK